MISLEVRNLGTGTFERGNYCCCLTLPDQKGGWESHEVMLEGYNRSNGWFELMCRALVKLRDRKSLEDTTDFCMEIAALQTGETP
jgi:hypothetical protein